MNKSESLNYFKIRTKYLTQKYLIPDRFIIKRNFKRVLGRDLQIEDPKLFNDKIQWLKLNWYNPLASKCADKYEVRDYVKEKIGDRYLNNLIGVYTSVDEIDFEKLPQSFVLKATHGSSWNLICKDKNNLDWESEKAKLNRWLKTDFFWNSREWVYKGLKPRIICEEFLSNNDGNPPEDYKVFCFDGEPKVIQVDLDRFSEHRRNFYDTNWSFLDVKIGHENDKSNIESKPKCLDELLELSRKLSKPFPHVRVDFYIVEEKLIFGELTFFHQTGTGVFDPPSFELEMGEWLKLPPKNRK